MSMKDNFLKEVKIGDRVELMIATKPLGGFVVDLDEDTVRIRKDNGNEPVLKIDSISYVDTYCKQVFDVLSETIKTITPDNTPYLEVAIANMAAIPPALKFNYEEPIESLLGCTVDMLVLETGGVQKINLRGVVGGKYRAVITKNYLTGVDLNEKIGQTVKVELEKINNGKYEARPII